LYNNKVKMWTMFNSPIGFYLSKSMHNTYITVRSSPPSCTITRVTPSIVGTCGTVLTWHGYTIVVVWNVKVFINEVKYIVCNISIILNSNKNLYIKKMFQKYNTRVLILQNNEAHLVL